MFNNIPTVTRNLLLINVIAFLATLVMPGLTSIGGLHFFLASDFHLYQLLTYMFLHGGFTHILFNMFALWMFGRVIESVWGPRRFLFYYLSCGIGAGLMQEVAQLVQFYAIFAENSSSAGMLDMFSMPDYVSRQLNVWTTVGASGAVYAILLAFGMIFPEERIFIFPLPIPVKAKWFVTFYVVIELFYTLSSPGDGVAHTAHLGGMLFGFLMIRYWRRQAGVSAGGGSGHGGNVFDSMRRRFGRSGPSAGGHGADMHVEQGGSRESDWEYNARKKARQDEVDRILDKIRKSGYDSLTKEEKKRLFDSSNND
ncbi:MAG: rhomboid family intramembrane serine protease [Prevotella sp.]|nr:rhomboid family intramembrane serine protease [Prevotella sp.]